MKKIIINSLFFFLFSSVAEAYQPNLSIYDNAEYAPNFSNFNYVSPQAVKGGKVTFPAYGSFDSFNPFIFKGIANSEAVMLTLDTLGVVPADDYATVYPLIAKEFEWPQDKSYVGFILDERAVFADGTPILADDVIFSFNTLRQKGSPLYKIYYADVEAVEKVNNRHVRFKFKQGSNNKELPLILAQFPIFSQKYFAASDFAKPSLKPILPSGPYKISSFEVGKYIVLKRNPHYWAKDLPARRGFFNFDEIRFDYYQDTTVTMQALFSGNLDIREEYIAKNWATGYNNEIVNSGKVIKHEFAHNKTAILQNFAYNVRQEKFADVRVRKALSLVFDFEWANEKLFYSQYKRLYSYFSNSELAASGLPQGREKEILLQYKKDLPSTIFTHSPQIAEHRDYLQSRQHLRDAVKLLQEAGYDFVNGKMTNLKTGQPLTFEVLSNSANGNTFTKVMLPFLQNLRKIGIEATFRNVEVNVFKNRLDNFDFDMAIVSFPMSRMPGNEQLEMWGSASADVKGSFNLIGVKNKVADALLNGLIAAQTKADYVAYAKAFDRVMLLNYYMIPQWYSPVERVAFWDRFEYPQTDLHVGFEPYTWWIKP